MPTDASSAERPAGSGWGATLRARARALAAIVLGGGADATIAAAALPGVTLELARGEALRLGGGACVLPDAARLCARTMFPPAPATAAGEAALASTILPSLARMYGEPRGPAAPARAALAIARGADGALVGLSGVVLEAPPAAVAGAAMGEEMVARIAYVAVEPALRRRGVARALVAACEEEARARWAEPRACLFVIEGNAAARALYESLGYADAGPPVLAPLPAVQPAADGAEAVGEVARRIEPMARPLCPAAPAGPRLARAARRARRAARRVLARLVARVAALLLPTQRALRP